MRVEPLSDALGAQLLDFDIKEPLSPDEQAGLRELFCAHHFLLVRGQEITADAQTRFVESFGPVHQRRDGKRETYISNRAEAGAATGQSRLLWHQDGTYGIHPGIATSLWAQEVSSDAVPTRFANAVRALEQLPADLRARIEPLHTVHGKDVYLERTDIRFRAEDIPDDAPADRFATYEQPIVYQMPHSGQKTLLASEFFTSHVVELPRDEGEALLQDLFSRLYAPGNVYTHAWQTNDMIIWDNMALHHCRPADMGTATRRMRRQSLDGWYTGDGTLDWPETVIAYARAAD
jgi:taurine dioxygenase